MQQLQQAPRLENVSYQVQLAEKTSFMPQSFDLITVAQAIHWFDFDTFYAEVVKFGFDEGIDVVNDISGGDFDDNLLKTVAKTKLPYILMHSNSTYQNMHEKIQYEDIIVSLNYSFSKKINELQKLGIYDVILDPGFGFGKTIEDQYKMIDEVQHIGFEKFPLLIGISRKSFIYKPLGKLPTEINEETQNLHRKVLEKGAKILRVHDVAETRNLVGEL